MTRVVINEAGIRGFMSSEGTVGVWLAGKTAAVYQRAFDNALGAGTGPSPRTYDLVNQLRFDGPFEEVDALFAIVGTDATHRGYEYTRDIEYGGVTPQGTPYRKPFLEPAVRDEFGL